MDVLAGNSPAAALITDFGGLPPNRRNYVYLTFAEPAVRDPYRDWPRCAKLCVAQLHMEVARNPQGDLRLNELVGELSVRDADFRRWWSDHHVVVRSSGVKEFRHPEVGDLTLDWDTLTAASDPDQQLISWSAKPGSLSLERLQALAKRHS
ncbi:MmyB family transcriptional regulator [Dietzia sp.]|uniref:MmyB family transcriptional regulator n=1 Tax=Dietzia sp. TaxID=1871616 RepID=UPI002FD9B9AA